MKVQPPKLAWKFFRWFCRKDYLEEVEGDLVELFEKQYEISPGRAKRNFTWSVLRYFRRGFIRSFRPVNNSNTTAMFRHNLFIALRNFKRYKSSFLINLTGLSMGLASVLLIYLWVNDEFSIDAFLRDDGRTFQVLHNIEGVNGIETIEATPAPLATALKEEIPEVEYSALVIPSSFNVSKGVVSVEKKHIKSVGQYVSTDFLKVLPYPLLYGNDAQVMTEKNSAVISKHLAISLFKSPEKAIGKTLSWHPQGMEGLFLVTGVLEDLPANATNQFDLLLNYDWYEEHNGRKGWSANSPRTFVRLKEGTDVNLFNDKMTALIESKKPDSSAALWLQKFSDGYLYGNYENGKSAGGRIEYVVLFITVAAFILIIACINFMNIFTARASRRSKEVGVKKALGANRSGLILQYLSESTLMAFLSLISALILVLLVLPKFNQITGKHIQWAFDLKTILLLSGITMLTGLISGSYPALYLSRFSPVRILKGTLKTSASEFWVRKGLIIFQFSISVILIVSVLVVNQQLAFIQHGKSLGFDRNNVIHFEVENMSDAFIADLRNIPEVLDVGGGRLNPGSSKGGTDGVQWEGKPADASVFFSTFWMSYHLTETLGMEMVEGRYFSENFGSDDQVILNEEAVQRMGIENPVGQFLQLNGTQKQIVGVIRDFHFESLYKEVKPCILLLAPMRFAPMVSVKIQEGSESATITKVRKVYETHLPGLVFDYKFMDDDYQRLYASENRVAVLSKYFTGLAVLISCLGLLGLASFVAERRLKEIGIRKVLGANLFEVVKLLSGDFIITVIIALLISLPLSYLFTSKWLGSFAYSIDLAWWYFVSAGLASIIVTCFTVGFQTLKTARISPVKSLRAE